ncbi:hydrolase [Xylariales sp. AK1849]|nr:hydrolase [Xylariales sp. AK1849]
MLILYTRRSISIRPWSLHRHADTMTARDSQVFTLPDGRKLGYAEYGCPNGYPLFYFHGFPMSRLEAWGTDKIARNRGIRVIALDRPGFGLSTFQPSRRITDWPGDVRAFAEERQLQRFAVLGSSGGGPYALACAQALPGDMLSTVGVLSGAGPWEAGTQDVPLLARGTHLAATWWPAGLKIASSALVESLQWIINSGPVVRRIDAYVESLDRKKEDWQTTAEELSTAERRDRITRVGFEGFAEGTQGFVQEAQLLTGDWGFKMEDIVFNKVRLWHGTKDTNSPIRHARYMDERLPHSFLQEFEGEDHSTMFYHLERVLLELIPEAGGDREN